MELDIWLENERGEITTPGTATVTLPSRAQDGSDDMTLHDESAPIDERVSTPARTTHGRFAEAAPKPPTVDQIDVVLGEWASERPGSELAPVAVTARVSRLAQILQQRMERTSSRFDLDWGQFLVLAALRGAGPPFRMSPRELHRLLLLSPAAVTNRLYRLEAKGLIERTSDPADRRSLPVILTVQGLSTVDRAMAACVEAERDLLAGVDADDLETTLRTMRLLLTAYEEYPTRRRRRRGADREEEVRAIPTPYVVPLDPGRRPDLDHAAVHELAADRATWSVSSASSRAAQTRPEPWRWTGEGEPAIGAVFVSLPSSRFKDHSNDIAWAAAVVMVGHNIVATATATRQLVRAYQPGYLALTVGPDPGGRGARALAAAGHHPGQRGGPRPHPRGGAGDPARRRAVGLPTVGVTERPDVGIAPEPGAHRGDWTPVRADSRLVGFRVRTLARAKPLMAHAAWLTTPETARDIVIRSTGRMRVPEPFQQARQLSRRLRSEFESTGTGMQDGIHRMKRPDWPVAIIGAGTMGHGIARAGRAMRVRGAACTTTTPRRSGRAKVGIETLLDKALARGSRDARPEGADAGADPLGRHARGGRRRAAAS